MESPCGQSHCPVTIRNVLNLHKLFVQLELFYPHSDRRHAVFSARPSTFRMFHYNYIKTTDTDFQHPLFLLNAEIIPAEILLFLFFLAFFLKPGNRQKTRFPRGGVPYDHITFDTTLAVHGNLVRIGPTQPCCSWGPGLEYRSEHQTPTVHGNLG